MKFSRIFRILLCCMLIAVMSVGSVTAYAAESDNERIKQLSSLERYGNSYISPGVVALYELRALGVIYPGAEDAVDDLVKPAQSLLYWNPFADLLYDSFGRRYRIPVRIIEGVSDDYQRQINWLESIGVDVSEYGDKFVTWDTLETVYRSLSGDESAEFPLGISNSIYPTYGDVALIVLSLYRDYGKAPYMYYTPVQVPFPDAVIISPRSYDDALVMLDRCVELLVKNVHIDTVLLSAEDNRALYCELWNRVYSSMSNDYTTRFAYDAECDNAYMSVSFETINKDGDTADLYAARESYIAELKEREAQGEITTYERSDLLNLWQYDHNVKCRLLSVSFNYNDAYEVYRDRDPMFHFYIDKGFGDRMYARYLKQFSDFSGSEKEYIREVRDYICRTATYDWDGYYSDNVAPIRHMIDGYDRHGIIVCDGYASVFNYFMKCRDILCVNVLGSTKSQQDALDHNIDHCWSKVYVDAKWYNMDICWDDTTGDCSWDFASDAAFSRRQHWSSPDYYSDGFYAAS